MNLEDVRIYSKAKRQLKIGKYILSLAIIVMVISIAWMFTGVDSDWAKITAITAFIVALLSQNGFLGWGIVSQSQLIEIIERQINCDPEAIKYLSDIKA